MQRRLGIQKDASEKTNTESALPSEDELFKVPEQLKVLYIYSRHNPIFLPHCPLCVHMSTLRLFIVL